MPASRNGRRAPTGAQRRRDPERTKERILTAAVEEFGDHGYAGARVSRIAARAGVNAQLISYYFDGKAGLFQALQNRWNRVAAAIPDPDRPMAEIAADFVRASGGENRSLGRLLVWEALGDGPRPGEISAGGDPTQDHSDYLAAQVADLRRRQEAGEFPADLDPAHLLLALFALSSAPTVLPSIVRRILGADPDAEEFREAYADQIGRLVRHLSSAK